MASLNKVMLIGNITRDPELKYTPSGIAVCTLGLATNRAWKTDSGEKKEEVVFHRLVVWGKLAETCSQYLTKGKKAYFEGRLVTRKWQTKEGQDRLTTEVVVESMLMLSNKNDKPEQLKENLPAEKEEEPAPGEEIEPNDIPF